MMKHFFVILIGCLWLAIPLFAQSNKLIRELEGKRGALQKQIAETESILQNTKKDVGSQLNGLAALTGQIEAEVTVKNTGNCTGTETLQLYIHDIAASVVRPVRELKDFKKVTLRPGEEKKVVFTITEQQLLFLTENGIYESEAGEFEIFIGKDSSTDNKASFVLKK